MATKDELLSLLREQRDRIADQIDGVNLALESGCNNAQLALLLVPGFGVWVYLTARAACSSDSADGLRARVAAAQEVIDKLQEMGGAVQAADPDKSTWPQVERAVRDLVNAAKRVDVLGDALNATTAFVDEVFAGIKRIPEILPDIGFGLGAAAAGVGLLLLILRR